jgi:hypothetical protein
MGKEAGAIAQSPVVYVNFRACVRLGRPTGMSGQFAAMSEFLWRGYNVAIPARSRTDLTTAGLNAAHPRPGGYSTNRIHYDFHGRLRVGP